VSHPALLQSLASTVRLHEPEYRRVRDRDPVLLPYASASVLFDVLATDVRRDPDGRRRVLRAIVLEYQRTRHPLWHALAFRGLAPMLGGLRARLRHLEEDQREQELHIAFIEGIGRLRLDRAGGPTFPLLTLRRAIARALFASGRSEPEAGEEVAFDEGAPWCAPAPHEDPSPFVHCLAREVGALLGEDVVRVLAGGETLDEQAERLATAGETYEGLRKRHRRGISRARRELRSPRSELGRR